MKNRYIFHSNVNLNESISAFPSSDSIPKLTEKIEALQEKLDILQRRYVRFEFISVMSGSVLRAKEIVRFIRVINPHLGFGWNPSSLFGSIAGSITWARQRMSKTRTR